MFDTSKFYHKRYWKPSERGATCVACEADEATVVEIVMPCAKYGFGGSMYEKSFRLPDEKYDLERYENNLRRAFEMGRDDKAREVSATLEKLLNPDET